MGPQKKKRKWNSVPEKTPLTHLLRQCPQEVEGCSLDTNTATQSPTETTSHTGAGVRRAITETQYGHRSSQQRHLGPGGGALGLQGGGWVSRGLGS